MKQTKTKQKNKKEIVPTVQDSDKCQQMSQADNVMFDKKKK